MQIISLCALVLLTAACNKKDTPGPGIGHDGIPCTEPVQEEAMSTKKPQLAARVSDTSQIFPGHKPPPNTQR